MESRMQEVVNKHAEASERRMDRKFAALDSKLEQSFEKASETSKRLMLSMFDKQNQLFLNTTDHIQENMLKMDENIKTLAMQACTSLPHTEAPKLDIRKMSPVARSRDESSASDAAK
mmetsp:Transcript_16558/g.23613  ORF Transcript_16558/g.23613 Transcript_16558/m.23613 type:complete len:117 (+) Transcript_16558:2150-2500(+)